MSSIPVIDLSRLAGGERGRAGVVDAVMAAYGEVGFAYLVGHGVAPELMGAVFAASKAFHALPLAQKMAIELDANHRGYIPIASSTDRTSTLANVTKPNQSASFMMMSDDPPGSAQVVAGTYLAGPNRWPELPQFRRTVEAYHAALCELGQRMMEVVASALGDSDGAISAAFVTPTTWLRLLHYPSVVTTAASDLYGSAPHRDFGGITILAQDEVGGLQVADPLGEWIDVPPLPGAFVMNVGDMLHRWSNGRLLSTPHRVINRTGRERYSVPFFFDPHMATVIEPLPGCVDAGNPGRFEPIEFGQFVRSQLTASYDRHQRQ
jgi:isopenicillin N synthase-like dioxygenase